MMDIGYFNVVEFVVLKKKKTLSNYNGGNEVGLD
jgi:hypothetical protein